MNVIKQAKRAPAKNVKFVIAMAMIFVFFFACLSSSLPAQSYRGAVRGFVHDQSGAVVVGAKVTARNFATGFSRDSTTEADGGYVIPELPAGQYEVKAESKGFAVQLVNAVVQVGKDTPLDLTLAVAGTGGGIVVNAAAPLIDTSETQLSMDVQNRLVEELPLNGRDFTKLVALVPGATVDPSGVAGTEKGTGQFNINGNRDRSNNYTLDGTDNNDPFHNNSALNQVGIAGAPATLLPLDSIQEFNIQGQFPAEYGRNTGSVVNVITKSGTNELHGTAYGYARNSYFDARNFFDPAGSVPQTLFINNDFGGSIGGPVIHHKTFFFGAYEGQRERTGPDFNLLVPTTADRSAAIALATSIAAANGMTINTGPTDALLAKFFPPNATNSEIIPFSEKIVNNDDNFILKVDHNFSSRNTLSARYAFGQGNQNFPFGALGFEGASRLGAFSQISPTRVQLLSVSFVSALDATHVNEVRFGYTRFRTSFTSADANFDPSTLGFNFGTGKLGLPEIDFNGVLDNLGATAFSIPRGRISQDFQLLDNFTWIHGTHTFKFGGEYRRVTVNSFNDNLERGLLAFFPCGTTCTPTPPPPVIDVLSQYYLAGGANGEVFSEALQGNTQRNTFNNGFSFFAQDDWRLKPKFTVSAGLRWEYFGVLSGGSQLLSGLDASQNLVVVGSPTLRHLYNKDLDNFGPRIGFAWNPLTSTVVRASYGIYYDYIPQDILLDNFTNSAGVSTNPIGPKPVTGLDFNPTAFSSIPLAPTPAPPVFTPTGFPNSIFYVSHNLDAPYVQTWGLNIQQQVRKSVAFEAGYVGTKGTRLTRLLDTNQPDTQTGLRPNPNYRFMDEFATISNSTYHALQLIARLSDWHGLTGFTSYVFSKSLDDASDGIDFNFATAALPQNSNNLKAEKGPSTFDSKHRFTNALNYRVPVWGALPEKLGKGWQLNTIITAMSGRPIPITDSTDTSTVNTQFPFFDTSSNFHQRPNVVPGVPLILPHWNIATGYLNPAAFTQPPPGTFGDLGRDEVYGPGFWNVDFSVSKDTRITERLGLQLRAEFFNIFNHPQWGLPSGSFSPGSPLGLITQTPDVAQGNPGLGGGGPRVLQFAARFQF
jgi:outer membrane receptor protein involved in Fe transport